MSLSQLPETCRQALQYYIGNPNAYPNAPVDPQAYCTVNALLMDGIESEQARALEGKPLNPEFLCEESATAAFCADLIAALRYGGIGKKEQVTYRVSRKVDVDKLIKTKQTASFTSTSKKGFLSEYRNKDSLVLLEFHISQDTPRADMAELLKTEYTRPEDAEVLLPPWLPVRLNPALLSEQEKEIHDRNGNPPLEKYIVYTQPDLQYPEVDLALKPEPLSSEEGQRVFAVLKNGKTPDSDDVNAYLAWKKKLLNTVVILTRGLSLREIFNRELDENRYITNLSDQIDDLFERERAAVWIRALLGIKEESALNRRIRNLSAPRLIHTITTYLLGCHLQENLLLSFDTLPRIYSSKTTGGAFSFFWSLTCLCHDIGYIYEREERYLYQKEKMLNSEERKELLEIETDMLELSDAQMKAMLLSDEEYNWSKKSIDLIKRYNQYRVGKGVYDKAKNRYVCVDHGIAGGMILFDYLHSVVKPTRPNLTHRDPTMALDEDPKVGQLEANRGHSRFLACALLVSLAIARHNIWTQDDQNKSGAENYKLWNLEDLIIHGDNGKLHMERPLEQLLYFLEYLDTIDPVKAFYVKCEEDEDAEPIKEEDWKAYLLEKVFVRCVQRNHGWHGVDILLEKPKKDPNSRCSKYLGAVCGSSYPKKPLWGKAVDYGIAGWLYTKQPVSVDDTAICLWFPVVPRSSSAHPFGITETEIMDLCLYQGSGDSVRPGLFYQIPNAYQTFNLLMMDGLVGERVRIGSEHQRPNGIYIRDWRRTIGVFRSIFFIMCKYAAAAERYPLDKPLYRGDRSENTRMMLQHKSTFAFTSTSKTNYLESFVKGKNEPAYVTGTLRERVPVADFEEILNDRYVYADEAEVLLPPFLEILDPVKKTVVNRADIESGQIHEYKIDFGPMRLQDGQNAELLDAILDSTCAKAAETLDLFRNNPDTAKRAIENDYTAYCTWKTAFQKLVAKELGAIYYNNNFSR